MKFLKLAETILLELSYGHTVWITDKGKTIDISRTGTTHHDWANSHRQKFKYNDNDLSPFAMTARSGWLKIRNHVNLDIEGSSKAIHKNRKIILEFVDDRLFTAGEGKFSMMIQELDDDGSVNKRSVFLLPRDDSKLQRYL